MAPLKKGERAQVIVDYAERKAIVEVLRRLPADLNKFEGDLLRQLLDRIDNSPRV